MSQIHNLGYQQQIVTTEIMGFRPRVTVLEQPRHRHIEPVTTAGVAEEDATFYQPQSNHMSGFTGHLMFPPSRFHSEPIGRQPQEQQPSNLLLSMVDVDFEDGREPKSLVVSRQDERHSSFSAP